MIDTASDAGAWKDAIAHPPYTNGHIDVDLWALGITLTNRSNDPVGNDGKGASVGFHSTGDSHAEQ